MEDSIKKKPRGCRVSTLLWPYPAPVYTNKAAGVELMPTLTSLWALCVCVTELMASDTGGGAGLASNETDGGRGALHQGRRPERVADTLTAVSGKKRKQKKRGRVMTSRQLLNLKTATAARWFKEGTKEKQHHLINTVLVMFVTVLTVYLEQTPLMSHSGWDKEIHKRLL